MDEDPNTSIVKAAGQIAVETARDMRAFIGRLFGPATDEAAGMLGDQMRAWRFQNLARLKPKIEDALNRMGVQQENLRALPTGIGLLTFDAASQEEDDDVLELWARLIANAVDPERRQEIKKVYVDLLKSMTSAEAALLQLLWIGSKPQTFDDRRHRFEYMNQIDALAEGNWRKYSEQDRNVAAQNLIRQRCVALKIAGIPTSQLFAAPPREVLRQSGADRWSFVDAKRFQYFVKNIVGALEAATGARPAPIRSRIQNQMPGDPNLPEFASYALTPLGKDLMAAVDPRPTDI